MLNAFKDSYCLGGRIMLLPSHFATKILTIKARDKFNNFNGLKSKRLTCQVVAPEIVSDLNDTSTQAVP